MLDSLTDRDREVLREQVADKIDALLPMTRMGVEWRATFQAEASRLTSLSLRDTSENALWGVAHAFVLRESV